MTNSKITLPPALRPGSTIGIIAPSGRISDNAVFERGIRILHEMGFKTKFPRKLWPGHGYLADSDSKRAHEFSSLWADTDVDAIMAARGGYGCLRIADRITSEIIECRTKLFIGFSDATLLHNILNTKVSCATLHGPVVTSLTRLDERSLKQFRLTLTTGFSQWVAREKIEILQGQGKVTGVGCGGNLTTLISTLGTTQEPRWQGKIVFLEDTGEPTYKIDRMLTQLQLCGKLDKPGAIILGDFSHGLHLDRTGARQHHESIWQRLIELTDESVPIWGNFPMGHGSSNHLIPFGVQLLLDNSTGTLQCVI